MNYYKRHLGDYAKDTGHLTALEHGIYTLLLDWYYVNERPIPTEKAIRIAKGNQSETESVLSEFFHLTEDGWRHHYADREIAAYQARAEINRVTGKMGGRPRKNQTETQTVSETEPTENRVVTLASSHKPVANKEQKTSAPAKGQRLPENWEPSEAGKQLAAENSIDWRRELEKFRDYWRARSGRDACKLDWDATWRNRIRDLVDYRGHRSNGNGACHTEPGGGRRAL